MKLWQQRWFWILALVLVLITVATAMVFTGHLEATEALQFFAGPAIALPVGYVIGKEKKQ